MTRKALFGVLAAVSMLIAGGTLGVAGATAGASEAGAVASPAPLAQETTTQENGTTTQESQQTTMQGNQSENATASVTLGDQPSNGSVVVVNETNLSAGGFVVILNDSSAVVGNTSYLESGSYENLTVELDPEMNGSGVLAAVPHLDTDDDRTLGYNATRAQEVGPANATDGPYLENGVPGGDTAWVTVGNETTRRTTVETLRAAW